MMSRILEPELMQAPEQVQAYAQADFAEPHNQFIQMIAEQGHAISGPVLDLGCGPGDVTVRFARKFKDLQIDAVDGSEPMLAYARKSLPADLQQRVRYLNGYLPDEDFSTLSYRTIISNSLLHHLPDPKVFWQTVKHYAAPGAYIFIMDLYRPENIGQVGKMVLTYAADEPEILQTDFYNSLLAAFTPAEIAEQLQMAGLALTIKQVSDRHLFIYGNL